MQTKPNKNKAAYRPPAIRDLGDFRELTRKTGPKMGSKNDGKGVPATRL